MPLPTWTRHWFSWNNAWYQKFFWTRYQSTHLFVGRMMTLAVSEHHHHWLGLCGRPDSGLPHSSWPKGITGGAIEEAGGNADRAASRQTGRCRLPVASADCKAGRATNLRYHSKNAEDSLPGLARRLPGPEGRDRDARPAKARVRAQLAHRVGQRPLPGPPLPMRSGTWCNCAQRRPPARVVLDDMRV